MSQAAGMAYLSLLMCTGADLDVILGGPTGHWPLLHNLVNQSGTLDTYISKRETQMIS